MHACNNVNTHIKYNNNCDSAFYNFWVDLSHCVISPHTTMVLAIMTMIFFVNFITIRSLYTCATVYIYKY